MSSNTYRSNTSGAGWRQREIEKAKARKEAELKAKEDTEKKQYANTEKNFPSLIGAGAGNTHVAFDHTFSNLARNWQKADDYEEARQAYEKEKARKARNEFAGVYIHRFREGRMARTDEEEYVEEETHIPMPPKVDNEGWEEVKRKAIKTSSHELTEAELARKYEAAASESDEEGDMNSDLFDKRRRDEMY